MTLLVILPGGRLGAVQRARKWLGARRGRVGSAIQSALDQATASGMTHALRDAELLAQTMGPALAAGDDLTRSLSDYRERRHLDSWKYYDFVCSQAEMRAAEASEVNLFRAVSADLRHAGTLLGVFSDTVDPDAVFSVDSMQRILSSNSSVAPPADEPTVASDSNPFAAQDTAEDKHLALTHTVASFASPAGSRLLERVEPFHRVPKNTEGIRSKLNRLVTRGTLTEPEPGLFAQPCP